MPEELPVGTIHSAEVDTVQSQKPDVDVAVADSVKLPPAPGTGCVVGDSVYAQGVDATVVKERAPDTP